MRALRIFQVATDTTGLDEFVPAATEKMLRKRLEEEFEEDLSDKKALIRAEVRCMTALNTHVTAAKGIP